MFNSAPNAFTSPLQLATHAHTHTHARTHAHRGFEFDEIPESDKEEFAEWLEGIRSAEEEQEQEQLEQQQALELETEQQEQNSMDMQRSGSDRGEDTEGGVFEEHISSSRKLAISGTSATVAHSEGEEITVIYRNRGKLWTVP